MTTPNEDQRLHSRLLTGDASAPPDLFLLYHNKLAKHLRFFRPVLPPQLVPDGYHDAASSAIDSLIKNPAYFDPKKRSLYGYLRMAAEGDLLNMMRKAQRRNHRHVDFDDVAETLAGGNTVYEAVESTGPFTQAASAFAARLPEAERQALALMLDGERRTEPYAAALGVAGLDIEEQRRRVKQVKDRLRKRLRRHLSDLHDQEAAFDP